ncbi:hypothetical protein ACQ4PT_065606 [Festuca glaucescens]
MEGIVKPSTGKLVSLSEQELVDCDSSDGACNGRDMDNAFEFIVDGTCNSNRASSSTTSITGHEDVPANDKASLQKAVAAQPVCVAVDGGDNLFKFYKGGVLSGDCGIKRIRSNTLNVGCWCFIYNRDIQGSTLDT